MMDPLQAHSGALQARSGALEGLQASVSKSHQYHKDPDLQKNRIRFRIQVQSWIPIRLNEKTGSRST